MYDDGIVMYTYIQRQSKGLTNTIKEVEVEGYLYYKLLYSRHFGCLLCLEHMEGIRK